MVIFHSYVSLPEGTGGHRLMAPVKVKSYAINTEKQRLQNETFFATLRWHKGVCDTYFSCRQNHKSHLEGMYRL